MWKRLIEKVRRWFVVGHTKTTAACPWCNRDVNVVYAPAHEVFVAHVDPVCVWWVAAVRAAPDPGLAVEDLLMAGKLQPK